MWIPLVLVGSVLYWTLALGLGGMSLSALGGSSQEDLALQPTLSESFVTAEPAPDEAREVAIPVRFQSSPVGTGGNQAFDDGTGRLPAVEEPTTPAEDSAGRTSY